MGIWYWFSLSVGRFSVVGLMSFFHFFKREFAVDILFMAFIISTPLPLVEIVILSFWEGCWAGSPWYLNSCHSYPGNLVAGPFFELRKMYNFCNSNLQCFGSGMRGLIPDPNFSIPNPESERFQIRSRIKELIIFSPISSRKNDLWCSSRIQIFFPSRIPNSDPGVKKAPDPGYGPAALVFWFSVTFYP